ncbi:MAG: hypothetical protein NTW49_11275 [Bacteroidia bacterium]|nr:hypothetical protein [Bacteroidia bacterium]
MMTIFAYVMVSAFFISGILLLVLPVFGRLIEHHWRITFAFFFFVYGGIRLIRILSKKTFNKEEENSDYYAKD